MLLNSLCCNNVYIICHKDRNLLAFLWDGTGRFLIVCRKDYIAFLLVFRKFIFIEEILNEGRYILIRFEIFWFDSLIVSVGLLLVVV